VNSWQLKTVGAFRSWFSLLRLSIFICFVVRFSCRNCVFLQLQFGGYVKWVPKVWYRWRHVRFLRGLATWICRKTKLPRKYYCIVVKWSSNL
jgi:hypothetical protein